MNRCDAADCQRENQGVIQSLVLRFVGLSHRVHRQEHQDEQKGNRSPHAKVVPASYVDGRDNNQHEHREVKQDVFFVVFIKQDDVHGDFHKQEGDVEHQRVLPAEKRRLVHDVPARQVRGQVKEGENAHNSTA